MCGTAAGGLVEVNEGIIERCWATGRAVGFWNGAGGLVSTNSATIRNSYASTECISGYEFPPTLGVAGLVQYNSGTIENCYATGSVVNTEGSEGGLVLSNGGAVVNSFWDIDTSGSQWSDGGIGLHTADMWEKTTFLRAGWDFNTICNICDDCDYPHLLWGFFPFVGFYPPVDSSWVNAVKAGIAVPLQFSLGGDRGLDVFFEGYPVSRAVDCIDLEPLGLPQQTISAGHSGVAWNPRTGSYTCLWKTEKSWANTCRELIVRFKDGQAQTAVFKFK